MDVKIGRTELSAGERIRIEQSNKFSELQRNELWESSELVPLAEFGNATDDYRK